MGYIYIYPEGTIRQPESDVALTDFRQLNMNPFPQAPTGLYLDVSCYNNQLDEDGINCPFTVRGIRNDMRKLKNNKSCGADNILNEF